MALKKEHKDERLKQFPNSNIVAILDTDWCAFPVASVGDERYIEVTHTKSGYKKVFKNITEFKGLGKNWTCPSKRDHIPSKKKSWLELKNSELKAKNKTPMTPDDFTIEKKHRRKKEYRTRELKVSECIKNEDKYEILENEKASKQGYVVVKEQLTDDEALANIFYSAKSTIKKALADLGTHKYESYIGKGGRIREDISTLMKYKGNREDTLKPLVLDNVVNYLEESFNSQPVYHIENDDRVVMRAYQDPNAVVVGVDKDFYAQPVKFFNASRPEEGVIDGDCFGELWITETIKKVNGKDKITKKVRGYGRIFLYWQILAGDSSDHYKSNCFSDTEYGDISAHNDLVDCKDDKEALEKVIGVFKMLYPEPKVVTGWRGNDFLIDWLYVAREQFKMAAMLRFEGDARTLDTEFEKYGVVYDYNLQVQREDINIIARSVG